MQAISAEMQAVIDAEYLNLATFSPENFPPPSACDLTF